jgi:CheY-like chemotaxis protein
LVRQEDVVVSGGALASPEPERSAGRPTVLVVEDEILLRMAAAGVLRERGFTVAEAASGQEALAILQSDTKVHVVFSDVDMPGAIDGIDLAHIVAAEYPDIKVVITSGHLHKAQAAVGTSGFVPKPYNLLTLAAKIGSLCDLNDAEPTA